MFIRCLGLALAVLATGCVQQPAPGPDPSRPPDQTAPQSQNAPTPQETDTVPEKSVETQPSSPASADLESSTWRLVEVEGRPLTVKTGEAESFIQFDREAHRMAGQAPCNRLFGEYERTGNQLRFATVGRTKMFCEGRMADEEALIRALESTTRFKIVAGRLEMYAGDRLLARFERRAS